MRTIPFKRLRDVFLGLLVAALGTAPSPSWGLDEYDPTGDPTRPAGSAPERVDVTATTGEARLEIPIDVPRGTGGFEPTLVLRYSSLQGDGPFGVGWQLSLGEIRRSDRFGVRFDSTDKYELDGQVLVANATTTEYRTQTEQFSRIRPVGSETDRSWEVAFANGTIARFGISENGRIRRFADTSPGPTDGPIGVWLLEELEDTNGNEIQFSYDRSLDPGTAYPMEVRWTYRGGTPVGTVRKITFSVDPLPRPDPTVSVRGGIRSMLTHRIAVIQSLVGGTAFRTRTLSYGYVAGSYDTGRSRLTSTRLFGQGCDHTVSNPTPPCAMPVQTFTYNNPGDTIGSGTASQWTTPSTGGFSIPVKFVDNDANKGRYGMDLGVRFGDIDGDGDLDLIRAFNDTREIYVNTGYGWVLAPGGTELLDAIQVSSWEVRATAAPCGTVGITDHIRFASNPHYLTQDAHGDGHEAVPQDVQVIDLNDDGRVDFLISALVGPTFCIGAGVTPTHRIAGVWLNTGSGWAKDQVLSDSLSNTGAPFFVVSGGEQREYPPNSGNRGECPDMDGQNPEHLDDTSSFRIIDGGEHCSTGYTYPQGTVLADVDGDGRPDLVSSTEGSYQTLTGLSLPRINGVWLNKATGFEPHPEIAIPYPLFAKAAGIPTDTGAHLVDINGDGLPDVVKTAVAVAGVINDADPLIFQSSGVWLGNGAGWNAPDADSAKYLPPVSFVQVRDSSDPTPSWVTQQLYLATTGVHILDLNGDGLVDILRNDGASTTPGACNPSTMKAWIQDRSAGSGSVWVEDPRFAPPSNMCALQIKQVNGTWFPFDLGVRVLDADADGAPEFLKTFDTGSTYSTRALSHYADRLESYANGRGGLREFVYMSAATKGEGQGDADVDKQAKEPNIVGALRGSTRPVVRQITETAAPGATPYQSFYFYLLPLWNPSRRASQGFRQMEVQHPDGSVEDTFFWQQAGCAGRPSRREVWDKLPQYGGQLQLRQEWHCVVVPGSAVPGSLAGTDVGRTVDESSELHFGVFPGARRSAVYTYDDSTGFNFVSGVAITRPSGGITVTRTPEPADLTNWIVGRIDTETHTQGGITYRSLNLDYLPARGLITAATRGVGPRASGATLIPATTTRSYDAYGNLTAVTDAEARTTRYCYDGDSVFAGSGVACPATATATHTVVAGVLDPLNGVTAIVADLATGDTRTLTRFNGDVVSIAPDVFGRPSARSLKPAGQSTWTLLESWAYQDAPLAPANRSFVQQIEETGTTAGAIRTATYYDGLGRAQRMVTDTPSGYVGVAAVLDYAGRPVARTEPRSCASDPHCTALNNPASPEETSVYDALGRLVQRTTPAPAGSGLEAGAVTLIGHWPASHVQGIPGGPATENLDVELVKEPNGRLTERWFDGERLVWTHECSAVDPQAFLFQVSCDYTASTGYAYEPSGDVADIYDAVATSSTGYNDPRHRLSYFYDTLGRTTSVIDPDGGTSSTTYDFVGNVKTTTNARGKTTTYTLDPLDRVTNVNLPDTANDVVVTYDTATRRVDRETRDGYYWVDHDYDAFSRERRRTQQVSGIIMPMDFEYDLLGRMTKITYPSPNTEVTYGYQGAYLTQVCARANLADCASSPADYLVQNVTYDGVGRISQIVEPPGTRQIAYDGLSDSLQSLQFLHNGSPTFQNLSYGYDGNRNVTNVDDGLGSMDASYGYDSQDRLASFTRSGTTKYFGYDSIGNLKLRDGATPGSPANQIYADPDKPHAITQGANALNYVYDADGNATRRGSKYLTYDEQNRLTCVGNTSGSCSDALFWYTLDGTRLLDTKSGSTPKIVVGDWFQWDTPTQTATTHIFAFGREIAYRVSNNASLRSEGWPTWIPIDPKPLGWALFLVAGSGLLVLAVRAGVPAHVAERPATAAFSLFVVVTLLPIPAWAGGPPIFGNGGNSWVSRWIVDDHLGTAELVLDSSGGLVAQRTFDPFGKQLTQSVTETTPRLFTGQRFQSGAALYDFKARWYDADVGRFMSVDPVLPSLGNPQSHNPYSYVESNPVNMVDPDGTYSELVAAIVIIVVKVIEVAAVTAVEGAVVAAAAGTFGGDCLCGGVSPSVSTAPDAAQAGEGTTEVAQVAQEPAPGQSTAEDSGADVPQGETKETGREVHALEGGRVFRSGWQNPEDHKAGLGWRVSILHPDGTYTQYGHMDPETTPEPGTEVKAGDYIGDYAEPTNGRSSGPHVHVENRAPGRPGNPHGFIFDPPREPPLKNGRVTAPFGSTDSMHEHPHQGIDWKTRK